jgi:hypothetical protein
LFIVNGCCLPTTSAFLRKAAEPLTIVEVVVGCLMDLKERENVVNFIREKLPHVREYEMVKSKTAFKLPGSRFFK